MNREAIINRINSAFYDKTFSKTYLELYSMDKIEFLLAELDKGRLGEYQNINDILQVMYPEPASFESDEDFFTYTGRVESFLQELQTADLIRYRKEGFFGGKSSGHYQLFNDAKFYATITYRGLEKLKSFDVPAFSVPPQSIHIHGNKNQINQSAGHNNQITNEQKQIVKKKKPRWDIIGIVAIGVTILLWILDKLFLQNRTFFRYIVAISFIQLCR